MVVFTQQTLKAFFKNCDWFIVSCTKQCANDKGCIFYQGSSSKKYLEWIVTVQGCIWSWMIHEQ